MMRTETVNESAPLTEESKGDSRGAAVGGRRLLPELVRIEPGTFTMGAGDDDKFATDTERPLHSVSIDRPFALGRTPVTAGEYRRFQPNHDPTAAPEWPVVNVSWYEAVAFCEWLRQTADVAYRLPTEEEWEYACRAGSAGPFDRGDTLTPDDANYLYSEQGERVGAGLRTPVGQYPSNAFGLHDMHGNVCEWMSNRWRRNYATEADPLDAANRRVIRGGAWDHLPRLLRSAWRDGLPAATRRDNVGFRIAAHVEH